MVVLTGREVVAHGEKRSDTRASVCQTTGISRAVVGSATHRSSGAPDDLREVSPATKVGKVDVILAISWEVVDLLVVHAVGDHDRDLISRKTGANVLAVVAVALRSEKSVSILYPYSPRSTYWLCP